MLELNKIYNMDCITGMKKLPDNCIDLIVADPPYLADKKISDSKFSRMSKMKKEAYLAWSESWITESLRVLKNTGSIYVFAGNVIFDLYSILEKSFHFQNQISWIKKNRLVTTPQLRNWFPKCEIILYFVTDNKNYVWNPIVSKYGIMKSSNYQIVPNITKNMKEGVNHPSQKPLVLVRKFIDASSNENATVLDPFMGSGTTAIACKQLNRNYIGFEIDPEYIEIEKERLYATPIHISNFFDEGW